MKIKEKTKIKDLIPGGYELIDDYPKPTVVYGTGERYIKIYVSKSPRTFIWYLDEYFKTEDEGALAKTPEFINTIDTAEIYGYFLDGNYSEIPWGIRIELFRLICFKTNTNWKNLIKHLERKYILKMEGLNPSDFIEVLQVCPEKFLKSIVI